MVKEGGQDITIDFLDDEPRNLVLVWDKDDATEVSMAKRKFAQYLEKGWIAFAVTPDNKSLHVYEFDPSVEKIILTPIVEGG